METIKVNMSPNPLDVQTIHASQNDGEARQWEFELHNNGELIDTSEITEQLFFKSYKGGTEQILPENTSTPTTSPFLGDIRYPQGLLTNQEFTYRQSPTEEDGLAYVVGIKGQTLKWNQLVYNGNFASTDGWEGQSDNPTLSVADNSITVTMTNGRPSVFNPAIKPSNQYPFVANHKYLFSFDLKATKAGVCLYLRANAFGGGLNFFPVLQSANTWTSYKSIVTATNTENIVGYIGLSYGSDSGITVGDSFSLRNLMIIDITALGIADKTNAEILQWFADYFPLDYYSFNSGSILSFNGTGIKTANADETEEHTTNLPISTYFPTGMKSAGNVYDELTPSKAITRIGAVDLGTLTFNQSSNFYYRQNSQDLGIKADATVSFIAVDSNITSVYYYSNSGQFRVYVNDISIAPSGMLYYELATPTETSFTTASLVTENAEIPLSNEDGVLVGKCTEELSAEPGFHDAKIKLADADGECYSNKLQLHVERSPQ